MSELKCNATFGDGGSIGHVWIYGGENTPDDWPCQCGALRYDESDELERIQKENTQLRQQLAEAQDNLRRVINETDYTDYLKRKVKTSQAYQVATERSYKVQVEHLKAELKEAQEDLLEFMRSRKGKVEELKAANERIAELEGAGNRFVAQVDGGDFEDRLNLGLANSSLDQSYNDLKSALQKK